MINFFNQLIVYFFFLLLIACGGGSNKEVKNTPKAESTFGVDKKFEVPKWSGDYRVSTTTYAWQDDTREEPHTLDNNDFREIQVRLFYPTDQVYSDKKLSVLPQMFWQRVGSESVISGKKLRPSNYQEVYWDIEIDAPISDVSQTYPLIILSNGYGFTPEMHVIISAELASRGFIVASINHPYGSGVSNLLSGETVHAQSLPQDNLGADLTLWSNDQLFALTQLQNENLTENSQLFGRLDHRVGTMGHSYGGAAAYYSAWQDDRVLAAINLDGTVFDRENKYIDKPFMYIQNDNGYDHDIFNLVNNDGFAVVFQNQINHHAFADYSLFWAWDFPDIKAFGAMDSYEALMLISSLCEQFFNRYFDGGDARLLDGIEGLPNNIQLIKF